MSWTLRVILAILPLTLLLVRGSSDQERGCVPSFCGKISNISYPFRLKEDPHGCGDSRYELTCENNVTTLYLYSSKYHVESINYNNFTIRVVDPGLQKSNCSSMPLNFLSRSNFCDTYEEEDFNGCTDPYHAIAAPQGFLFQHIVYMNCSDKVTNNPKYVETSTCMNWKSKGYIYAIAGDLFAENYEIGCHVKFVAPTSLSGFSPYDDQPSNYDLMHIALLFGFEISWMHFSCKNYCGTSDSQFCSFNTTTQKFQCYAYGSCFHFPGEERSPCGIWTQLSSYAKDTITGIWIGLRQIIKGLPPHYDSGEYRVGLAIGKAGLPSFFAARFLLGMTLFIALLIHKWRRRHFSMYENIEVYLQQQNNMSSIAYSYKEIKKMGRGFREKLGEGGFGSVFKGYLRSGPCVAIKMLAKSKGNGQDFINEVATIGRIHHLNVVKLIGFCVEGSKRALVYEFMPNGSLDKVLFSKEGSINLSYDKIYDISIGVARGIAYLHHGCEMKILHFDIKPHNILLDENFIPKVSDFGLAKLYPVDNSIVTMTAARGTIGYMAPELFYKNIGGVSYKADVYSFGMLLMEMASKRRNLRTHVEHSSQIFFPLWIYDQLEKEEEVEIDEDVTEEEKKIVKKMIIVALWCIQLKPDDRPSMRKVVEMLEEDVESLEMPPKPTLYPHETFARDLSTNSDQTMSSEFISSHDSMEIASDPLVENNA